MTKSEALILPAGYRGVKLSHAEIMMIQQALSYQSQSITRVWRQAIEAGVDHRDIKCMLEQVDQMTDLSNAFNAQEIDL